MQDAAACPDSQLHAACSISSPSLAECSKKLSYISICSYFLLLLILELPLLHICLFLILSHTYFVPALGKTTVFNYCVNIRGPNLAVCLQYLIQTTHHCRQEKVCPRDNNKIQIQINFITKKIFDLGGGDNRLIPSIKTDVGTEFDMNSLTQCPVVIDIDPDYFINTWLAVI